MSVDVSQLSTVDARIAGAVERHVDDAPTAALAVLLGVTVLSEDLDLLVHGLASGPPWLELVFASKNVTVGDTANFWVAITTSLTIDSIGGLPGRIAAVGATRSGQLPLLLGAVLISVIVASLAQSERARRRSNAVVQLVSQRAAPVLALAVHEYARAAQSRSTGVARLTNAALWVPTPLEELATATQLLAAALAPMSSKEIARQMWDYQRVPERAVGHVEALLRFSPMFVETAGGSWQLGRVRSRLGGPTEGSRARRDHSRTGHSSQFIRWPVDFPHSQDHLASTRPELRRAELLGGADHSAGS